MYILYKIHNFLMYFTSNCIGSTNYYMKTYTLFWVVEKSDKLYNFITVYQ